MSHGPMVSAQALLRVRRELDTLWWVVMALLAQSAKPAPAPRAHVAKKPAPMFDYKMRQAGERDDG